jgi:ATP-dependent DNA helicase RecQ
MTLSKKISEILMTNSHPIIIFKGFEQNDLPKENRYFSFEIEYFDKVNIDELEDKVIEEIIANREFSDTYKWMSIEEYQLFKEQAKINKRPIIVLENNLYYKQFPYRNTLSDVEAIYQYLYYQEDRELEPEQEAILKNVSYFYGQVDYSKQSGNYFVVYPEVDDDNIQVFKFYESEEIKIKFSENYPLEDSEQIELSDDELPFLDLEAKIINQTNLPNIVLIISGTESRLPNEYLLRLSILKKIFGLKLFFITLSIKRQAIDNLKDYETILKDMYGYETYRNIEFYKNIENKENKETIAISQAQIIDDIVQQSEKAINGKSFRDIYITAPTGAGKSVMFQVPSFYLTKKYSEKKPLMLVISPLIGLMKDQVANMHKKGVDSLATINGETLPYEREKIVESIQKEEINILYVSPETLQSRGDIKMLIGERSIGAVIIDEAHIVTT